VIRDRDDPPRREMAWRPLPRKVRSAIAAAYPAG
jgi:hypothetical protein